ncbi:MAG: hypothetical protein ACTSUZ_01195 [Candidatus Thorarchaeota archaeon]
MKNKQPKVKQSKVRPYTRTWEEDFFAQSMERRREERKRQEERRKRQSKHTQSESFWGGGRGY